MWNFDGKVAIVTGGNMGIGKAMALVLAKHGAAVVIAARREEEGRAVERQINAEGGRALFVRTDVSQSKDVENLVQTTVDRFGKLDLAFNNAGVAQFGETVVEIEEAEWDKVMAVNLKGVFLCMKYQIPAMLAAGGGAIVNTSSVGGLIASPGLSAYQASKHGVIGLTKAAALEFCKQGIRINAICPGGTRSDMFDSWIADPEVEERLLASNPTGRFAAPDEQAQATAFLLSDAASYIVGVALPVDGGFIVP